MTESPAAGSGQQPAYSDWNVSRTVASRPETSIESLPPLGRMTPSIPAGEGVQEFMLFVEKDLEQTEENVAKEFLRFREGLMRLDHHLSQQRRQQQQMLAEMEEARRSATRAAEDAAIQKQRMEALLSDPPWGCPPSQTVTGPATESPPPAQTSRPRRNVETPPEKALALDAPAEPAEAQPPPMPIASDAIDRIRLADSLYGAGEYDLALRMYQHFVNDPQWKKDQAWFFFQIAGCYRHRQDWSQSARFYRMVVAMPDNQGLGDTARWWLSHLEKREELAKGLDTIRTALKEIDAP